MGITFFQSRKTEGTQVPESGSRKFWAQNYLWPTPRMITLTIYI